MNGLLTLATLGAAVLVLAVSPVSGAPSSSGWSASVSFTNVVASSPTTGGGYPVPAGSRVPAAGSCREGRFNANHSESWLAVKPGSEDLVGTSKFFFDQYSTFYMFYLGAYQMPGGSPSTNNQVQGYDCMTGTQEMPPSWTDATTRTSTLIRRGGFTRMFQRLVLDATKLHPDGEIDVSYSDDLGRHWVKGNGGVALEPPNNASAKQLGHVEDKQWVAVNQIVGSPYQDHVYAAWAVFNGNGGGIKVRLAVSRDRGLSFDKAVTITPPSDVGPGATYVYPEIDAAGTLYVSVVSFPANGGEHTIYVSRSTDDGRTFSAFVPVTTVTIPPGEVYPKTRFRSGIVENFAASPTYAGHLYLDVRGLGPRRGTGGCEVHSVDRRRAKLVGAGRRERQRRPGRGADRSIPALGRSGPGRRGRGRVLRPSSRVPDRPEHPARGRRADELLHRHVVQATRTVAAER